MNRSIYSFMLAALLAFAACSDDDDAVSLTPSDRGTVTDDEGNTYEWVRIGDLDWTTSNALNGTPCYELTYISSYGWLYDVFEDEEDIDEIIEEYMPVYGNLMSYDDAVDSAPEGWRLPTDEDWMELECTLGMSRGEAKKKGWRGSGVADLMMQSGEGTELGLQLGGAIMYSSLGYSLSLELFHKGEFGYYWTATIDESYTDYVGAYYRKLCYGVSKVERQVSTTEDKYLSVRWVRDAD